MNRDGQSHLALIILAVRDLKRSLEFYRQVFGWPLLVDSPPYKEFQMPSGQRLGIYFHEGFGRNTGQPPTLAPAGETTGTELYFYATDPPALMAKLQTAGARLLSAMARRPWNDEAAYYADPDGHILVVAQAASPLAPAG